MIIKVKLNQAEMAACRVLGNLRSIAARGASVKDVQMGKNDPLDIDEDGVIGEYAFCKHWNICFDPTASPRGESYDCELKGKKIDVKSTRLKNGRLTKTLKPNNVVDIYALAIIDGDLITFPGYALAKELCREDRIGNLGHGDGYIMDQSELRQWKEDG